MKKNYHLILNILSILLIGTLFLPWILDPNTESFTIESVSGYNFLYNNPFVLVLFITSLITYIFLLKTKNNILKIAMILELLFLVALLISPIIFYSLNYLEGVLIGYYLAVSILILLIVFFSVDTFKGLNK